MALRGFKPSGGSTLGAHRPGRKRRVHGVGGKQPNNVVAGQGKVRTPFSNPKPKKRMVPNSGL